MSVISIQQARLAKLGQPSRERSECQIQLGAAEARLESLRRRATDAALPA